MTLRFPGLGMPIPVPPDGRGPPTHAENTTPTSPPTKDTAMAGDKNVVEVVSRVAIGAATGQVQGGEDDANAPPGKNTAFGDLFVEASVTLPAGEAVCFTRESFTGLYVGRNTTGMGLGCSLQAYARVKLRDGIVFGAMNCTLPKG